MHPAAPPNDRLIQLPHPDTIRAAIVATDERARLLRRLLRLALKLHLHLTTADQLPAPTVHEATDVKGAPRG